MYVPKHFAQVDMTQLHALMRAQPLATLVTLNAGELNANHIPLHLHPEPAPCGTLQGHVARSNTLWTDLADNESLAVFHGPNAYVSPSWYATKRETGRAVPTWNYTAVHAYGRLRVIDDAEWLRTQIDALTATHEAKLAQPWSPADAPADYIHGMLGAIIGIELVITRLIGKWKVSQNQPEVNRAGVVEALLQQHDSDASAIAALVAAQKTPRTTP